MNSFPEPESFNGPDLRSWPRSTGEPTKYRCLSCEWRGKGSIARADHWRETAHVVISADDPRFRSNAPYARYAFDWELGGITRRMFTICGGERDRSTVTEETVKALGLPVRK